MHQPRHYFWVAILLIVLLVGIGCTEAGQTDNAPTLEEGAGSAPTVEPTGLIPPRPTAAAAVEADFRPDSPLHVATTGRSQLIEFFAFW